MPGRACPPTVGGFNSAEKLGGKAERVISFFVSATALVKLVK